MVVNLLVNKWSICLFVSLSLAIFFHSFLLTIILLPNDGLDVLADVVITDDVIQFLQGLVNILLAPL